MTAKRLLRLRITANLFKFVWFGYKYRLLIALIKDLFYPNFTGKR